MLVCFPNNPSCRRRQRYQLLPCTHGCLLTDNAMITAPEPSPLSTDQQDILPQLAHIRFRS